VKFGANCRASLEAFLEESLPAFRGEAVLVPALPRLLVLRSTFTVFARTFHLSFFRIGGAWRVVRPQE